jgi:hypothetical protein
VNCFTLNRARGVAHFYALILRMHFRGILQQRCRPRGQVRSMWEWACELDRQELLWFEFARPAEIEPGTPEDIAVQLTEGWILGSSPTVRHH